MVGIIEVFIMAKLMFFVMSVLMIMLVVRIINLNDKIIKLEENKKMLEECFLTSHLDALCRRDGHRLWMIHKKGNKRTALLDVNTLCDNNLKYYDW